MRMRHLIGPVLAAAALLTGCPGDDDDGPPSTATAETGGESSSTTDVTDSEPSPTTPETTPATPPSTAAPTTAAPTTTTLPVEEQVRAAMLGYYEFYWRCLRAPSECDPLEVAVPDSDTLRALTATRDDLIEGNYFVGDEDEGYMVITAIEPAGDHTLVTTCWYSTAWLYFQPPIPDAEPTVQNNTPSSGVQTYQFVQMPDLSWKIRRADLVGEDSTENACPPEA